MNARPAQTRWPLVVLIFAIFLVFGRLCVAEFTSWDDGSTVYQNPRLNPPSLEHLVFVWSHFAQGLYVPVTYSVWMALALVAHVEQADEHGATLNPYVFHCANVFVHLMTAIVVYQLLRTAMADATATRAGIDPDRAGFTIAWQAARDQIIQAANVIAETVIDLVGTIGRHVLANLLPDRRLRVCPRVVKRAISKYQARGPNINRRSYKATLEINILTAPGP